MSEMAGPCLTQRRTDECLNPLARGLLLASSLALLLLGATTSALQGPAARGPAPAPMLRIDLSAHAGAHAVLAALLPLRPLRAFMASSLLAVFVEAVQATPLAPARAPAVDDVVAGAFGAALGAYGALLVEEGGRLVRPWRRVGSGTGNTSSVATEDVPV